MTDSEVMEKDFTVSVSQSVGRWTVHAMGGRPDAGVRQELCLRCNESHQCTEYPGNARVHHTNILCAFAVFR